MKTIKFGFLLLSLALAGCASALPGGAPTEETFRKGEISPDVFLSTVIVRPDGCAPYGAACTMAGPRGAVLIMPFDGQTPSWMYEMFAHEMCHVVAAVKAVRPDPCHREDGGVVRAGRGHSMRATEPTPSPARSAQEGLSAGRMRLTNDILTIRVP